MGVYYNSETLIDSVKRRINIPTNQNTFTDADILAFADEELMLTIVPAIMSLHEDHLLFSEDEALTSSSKYELPYRSVGNKLYDLQFVDGNGNVYAMTRTSESEEPGYNGAYTQTSVYTYYIKNNLVNLVPTLDGTTTGSLRFVYYIRPSALVPSSEVAVIQSIDRATGIILFASIPSGYSISTPCDFYKVRSPHTVLGIDATPTSVSPVSRTMTFAISDIPEFLSVGDHVALAEQCCIPQIPSDLHVFLAQKTAERILESQGDVEGLKAAQQKSQEMEFRAGTIIDNRVDSSPPKLVNRRGILRSGLGLRSFRRRG